MSQFKLWSLKILWTVLPLPRHLGISRRSLREFVVATGMSFLPVFFVYAGLLIIKWVVPLNLEESRHFTVFSNLLLLGWTVFFLAHAVRIWIWLYRRLNNWAVKEDTTLKYKASHVGAPAIFFLENACKQISAAYAYLDHHTVYHVGSSLVRPDWRDVDLRMILSDEDFHREFPEAHDNGEWELDTKWILHTTLISKHLSRLSGLPVDFQFQPMSWANSRYKGPRSALGITLSSRQQED